MAGTSHVETVLTNRSEITRALSRWGRQNARPFPWRQEIPLWQALVAEVMLLRTRAPQVESTFIRFQELYPSPSAFGSASADDLAELTTSLGLRWRGRLLFRLAQDIAARDGFIPLDQQSLETLPGVGPYTAAATLSLHANQRAVIVDSNVVRILSRLVGVAFDGETRRKRWFREFAEELTPPRSHRDYNYALLDLAAILCLPTRPACGQCPIQNWCQTGSNIEP